MGKRLVSSWFRYVDFPIISVRNSCKHFAGRIDWWAKAAEFKSYFRKVGDYKSPACQKENNEAKDISLDFYLIVCNYAVTVTEENVSLLGSIGSDFELYRIMPSDASADAVMTYKTYQCYTIFSVTRYHPSAFALYLYNTDKHVLYTVEDGAQMVDFKEVYDLLPENMKK